MKVEFSTGDIVVEIGEFRRHVVVKTFSDKTPYYYIQEIGTCGRFYNADKWYVHRHWVRVGRMSNGREIENET
jgi:hypothetical protein